ncbi:hypothetical protein VN12_08140 [Pirellula sp. SH-Sr6A]|uniref:DUF6304 family protein n=1 Tax=Pirellula sp. SH-Sr6A TaxID=1632865 RepID=UPI00078B9764|nr:DUF6304 family protein [Pirellula sp. SH-Sr6A]AMV32078.1 hypothetical protein VN12_08140 [Pirellula sp. SH-Sr6A]
MMTTYPASYKDKFGEESTTILNDGDSITMMVRGVRFKGNDFDSFEPQDATDPAQLSSFTFCTGAFASALPPSGGDAVVQLQRSRSVLAKSLRQTR